MIRPARKTAMHPRNRFREGYDFDRLVVVSPALARFVRPNPYGDPSIDYGDADAVKALNQALLKDAYGIDAWDLPAGYLCPPIPGRSDYVHAVADLLAEDDGELPRGRAVRVLDVGVGANCIYPIIGACEYGWTFVGSDIDPVACRWAEKIVAANPQIAALITCRPQPSPARCFAGVMLPGESFAASMCNPPFHASRDEAAAGSLRKRRHLGRPSSDARNFGGQPGELWCDGGELGFVQRMIEESARVADRCRWFTTIVSASAHLPRLHASLRRVGAEDVRTIGMAQGQKQSRMLAWTFMG